MTTTTATQTDKPSPFLVSPGGARPPLPTRWTNSPTHWS